MRKKLVLVICFLFTICLCSCEEKKDYEKTIYERYTKCTIRHSIQKGEVFTVNDHLIELNVGKDEEGNALSPSISSSEVYHVYGENTDFLTYKTTNNFKTIQIGCENEFKGTVSITGISFLQEEIEFVISEDIQITFFDSTGLKLSETERLWIGRETRNVYWNEERQAFDSYAACFITLSRMNFLPKAKQNITLRSISTTAFPDYTISYGSYVQPMNEPYPFDDQETLFLPVSGAIDFTSENCWIRIKMLNKTEMIVKQLVFDAFLELEIDGEEYFCIVSMTIHDFFPNHFEIPEW